MKMIHRIYPVQDTIHGQSIVIHAYTFQSELPGPSVYIQANLHGSEILGTVLLSQCIHLLQSFDSFSGKITIVPCANPLAVGDSEYNGIAGRWSVLNGVNWNRIFSKYEKCEDSYAQQRYFRENIFSAVSVEEKLAHTLQSISWGHKYVVDVHTTGAQSVSHLFTHKEASMIFAGLDAHTHIIWDSDDFYGAFDESQRISQGADVYACTWEVGPHNTTDSTLVSERLHTLTQWMHSLWDRTIALIPPLTVPILHAFHVCAPYAGYYVWRKQPGEIIVDGEVYADVYQPWNTTVLEARLSEQSVLLGIYGVYAISSGEQIGFAVRTPAS